MGLPTLPVHNVHRRDLPAALDEVGALIETLGGPHDAIWPAHSWMPLWLDGPLALGVTGGHGPARYRVVAHDPGRLVRFRFERPGFMTGFHEFSVEPGPGGRTTMQHLLAMRLGMVGWPVFPIAFLTVHNEVVEQALDRVERRVTGTVAHPVRPTRGNAVRRAALTRYFALTGSGPAQRRPNPVA